MDGLTARQKAERDRIFRFLRQNPAFVRCCFAAHKAGFLLPYLAAVGVNDITPRHVDYYEPLISELLEHPAFKFNFAKQVKEGIIAATQAMFPSWFKK